MKRYAHLCFITAMLFSLSACVKDLVFKQQNAEKKMVVNCLLDERRPIKIYLTETTSSLGNAPIIPINDAIVELYKNDLLWLSLPYTFVDSAQTFGGYISNVLPEPGNKYSVKISHPKYGIIKAEDTLPDRVSQFSCQMIEQGDSSNGYTAKLKIRFQENGIGENFYRLAIWQQGIRYHVYPAMGDTAFQDFEISCSPQITTSLSDTIRDGENLLFSDRKINGTDVEIELVVKMNEYINRQIYSGHLFVDFGEVSKAHYNYWKTIYDYQRSGLGYEDYRIYGNINNGYGIFMSQCLLSDSFDLK